MWQEYVMIDHCALYETLTIEEKLLVDKKMKEWMAEASNLCWPISLYRVLEADFITTLKWKEANDKRNRKSSASRADSK